VSDDDKHIGAVWTVVFSPTDSNGEFAASASGDNTIRVWDVNSRKCIQTLRGHTDMIWSLTFSHDGNELCSASDDGSIRIWNVNANAAARVDKRTLDGHGEVSFQKHLTLRGHSDDAMSVAYSHNGELMATASEDNQVKIWDPSVGTRLQTLPIAGSDVAFFGNNLVAATSGENLSLWDFKAEKCILTIPCPANSGFYRAAFFSPDGRHLATYSQNIHIWEVAAGRLVLTINTECDTNWLMGQLVYSRDGKRLVSSSGYDNTLRVWDTESGCCEREFNYPDTSIIFEPLTMSHSGRLLAAGSNCGKVMVWDTVHGTHLLSLNHLSGTPIGALKFTRGDSQLISAGWDGYVCVWSASTGMRLHKFEADFKAINAITISHDGHHLATASDSNIVKIWDIIYGRAAWATVFSYDNKMLASCYDGGTVRVWDLGTGGHRVVLEGKGNPAYAAAFSHDSRYIAVALGDGCVLVVPLNVQAGKRVLCGHRSAVWAVAYASDDRRLASTASDRTIRVWDTWESACLQVINVGVSLASIAFGMDGQYLRTEIGRIKLGDDAIAVAADASTLEAAASSNLQHDYAVSADRCWITDNGQKVLWLPREYQPLSVAVDDINNRICIGCQSGRILLFNFTADA
jgi:WD40 repeat protein